MKNLKLKIKLVKLRKNDKKKGFTLIELVAVLAIIAVLSATFVPKFSNYITEAKKVAVLNEAKSVVTAYEAVSYKIDTTEADTTVLMLQNSGMPLNGVSIDKIPSDFKVSQCKNILNTQKYTFNIDPESGLATDPTPTLTE